MFLLREYVVVKTGVASDSLSNFFSDETYVYDKLKNCSPNAMKIYRKEEIPDHYHYHHNERIQPIILVADEGWTIVRNETLPRCKYFPSAFNCWADWRKLLAFTLKGTCRAQESHHLNAGAFGKPHRHSVLTMQSDSCGPTAL